jgi:hypothetical protein
MTMLDGALASAAAGYAIFPTAPGDKRPPLVKGGFYAASRDLARLRGWWRKWPAANVATRTGGNLAVVEFDPRNGGTREAIAALGLPLATRAVRTPGGGTHYHYRVSRPVASCSDVVPGVDVKCDKGYVLLPPSTRPDGAYVWLGDGLDTPVADADPALLDAAITNRDTAHGAPGQRRAGGRKRPEDVRLGEVHNTLLSWAGWLAAQDYTEDEAAAVLARFVARIPAALDMDDTQDDIDKCLAWVYAREAAAC